jgi:hypothetical protein
MILPGYPAAAILALIFLPTLLRGLVVLPRLRLRRRRRPDHRSQAMTLGPSRYEARRLTAVRAADETDTLTLPQNIYRR